MTKKMLACFLGHPVYCWESSPLAVEYEYGGQNFDSSFSACRTWTILWWNL